MEAENRLESDVFWSAYRDTGGLGTFPRLLFHHAQTRATRRRSAKDLGIWQTWTWSDVAERVRALASGLAALGFKRGDNLAIIGDNRPHLYMMMSAAQCLGGVPVPFYQDAVADEMLFVLRTRPFALPRSRTRSRWTSCWTSWIECRCWSISSTTIREACVITINPTSTTSMP